MKKFLPEVFEEEEKFSLVANAFFFIVAMLLKTLFKALFLKLFKRRKVSFLKILFEYWMHDFVYPSKGFADIFQMNPIIKDT